MEQFELNDLAVEMKKPAKHQKCVIRTSQFVKCMRQWYEACDGRGLSPDTRLNMFQNMYDLLTEGVNFAMYPPPSTHIKGIPVVTFEGILQNISTRIALYKYAKNHTYNQCAVSTLSVENFFGQITSMEFSGLECPKSTDVMRPMGHAIQLIHHRLDPNRYVFPLCNYT